MSDPLNMGPGGILGEFSGIAMDFPRAYEVLSGTMDFQKKHDPEAGAGVLMGPHMWLQMKLDRDQQSLLLTLSNNDPALLYLVLRAYSFSYWPQRHEFIDALKLRIFPWKKALEHVRTFLPDFGGDELKRKAKELEHAAKHRRSHRRPSKARGSRAKVRSGRG